MSLLYSYKQIRNFSVVVTGDNPADPLTAREHVIPQIVTFPPSMSLVGGADDFTDLSDGDAIDFIGFDPNPVSGFSLVVSDISGDGSDIATFKASTTFGTDGVAGGSNLNVVGAVSARLRINDNGIPALSHRAQVEIQMPFSGSAYTIDTLILTIFSLCRAPTGYTDWEDVLKVTFGKASIQFNIQNALGGSRFRISYPGYADVDTVAGAHETTLWFRDIMSLNPAGPSIDLAEAVIGAFSTAGSLGVSTAAELDTLVATAATYPLKIERILSNPVSNSPELCGTVDTYLGPINLTLNNI